MRGFQETSEHEFGAGNSLIKLFFVALSFDFQNNHVHFNDHQGTRLVARGIFHVGGTIESSRLSQRK